MPQTLGTEFRNRERSVSRLASVGQNMLQRNHATLHVYGVSDRHRATTAGSHFAIISAMSLFQNAVSNGSLELLKVCLRPQKTAGGIQNQCHYPVCTLTLVQACRMLMARPCLFHLWTFSGHQGGSVCPQAAASWGMGAFWAGGIQGLTCSVLTTLLCEHGVMWSTSALPEFSRRIQLS